MTQSGGHCEVESQLGAGTTVLVYLPLVEELAVASDPPAPLPVATGQETILLVEDEAQVRQQGYQVLEASNGLEGLAVAEQHPGPISLVLMPHLSGDEMVERLRVLSAYFADPVALQRLAASGGEALHKLFSLAALTQRVREILDRE